MHYDEEKLDFVYQPIRDRFFELATDANGLPVIKKTLAKFVSPKRKKPLINIVVENALTLAKNAYGNYAI